MSRLADCHALECEPVPSSVRSARLFVVDKLQEWRYDELVDSAALMTSELATNATIHTDHPYRVSVSRREHRIRVEVFDTVGILPVLPQPTETMIAEDPGALFSGLGLVDRIAANWGSHLVQGGKVVWFEVQPTDGEHRQLTSDLAALRSPAPGDEIAVWDDGEEEGHPSHHQEASAMAKHRSTLDDREAVDERHVVHEDRRGGGVGRWLLVLLVIAALAIGGFFLLGGSADVDTEGDLEIPEVDLDVNAPDVEVDSEDAPPAEAEADASNG